MADDHSQHPPHVAGSEETGTSQLERAPEPVAEPIAEPIAETVATPANPESSHATDPPTVTLAPAPVDEPVDKAEDSKTGDLNPEVPVAEEAAAGESAGEAAQDENPTDPADLPQEEDAGHDGNSLRTSISNFSVGLSVDSEDSDAFSDLGDMNTARSSVSVNSSVYEFVEEFGRTFHKYKEGKYFLPNDEKEQSRLDLQHSLATRLLEGKLYLAPIGQPHRVLDFGTGTGIWAIEYAEQHPESDVLGTDLSPIQPEYVPPNCRFEVDDIEDEWVFSYKFDFIHGRYIVPFVQDPVALLHKIYDNLKPGGYVELMETLMLMEAVDDSLEGHVLQRWNQLMVQGVRRTGRDPLVPVHLKRWLGEVGFINVTETKFAVPSGPWAKGREQKIRGALMNTNILEAAQAITMNICTKVWGWTTEEVEVFLADIRKGMRDRSVHAYVPVVNVWAQKPE